MRPGIRIARGGLVVVVSLLLLRGAAASTVLAQGIQDDSADAVLARRLVQLAAFRAAVGDEAGFEESVIYLRTAHELTPNDLEIDRRLVRAGQRTGDAKAEFEARRRILKRDPDDHRNLLHVIRQGISERQSVAERLAAYDRFLGPSGRAIPATVRSRLAYDGAVLQREHGNEAAFLEWLKLSLALDPYFRESAALAALIVDTQSGDPVLTAEALVKVLRTDPTNIAAIDDLTVLLMDAGAYGSARVLLTAMREIPPALWGNRAQSGLSLRVRLALATAGAEGPAAGLAILAGLDQSLQSGQSATGEASRDFDSRRFLVNRAAAILGDAAGDVDARTAALNALSSLVDDAAEAPHDARLEVAILRVWLENDPTLARELLGDESAWSPSDRSLLTGWSALVDAGPDSHFGSDDLDEVYQLLGTTLTQYASGRQQAAVRGLANLYADDPASAIGLWAKFRLESELGRSFAASDRVSALAALVDGVADELQVLYTNPDSMVTLRVSTSTDDAAPLDPIVLTIDIRNNSEWSLPIGANEYLPESVMIWPSLTVSGQRTAEQPLVADLSRRFRIAPGETMTIRTRIDLSQLGLSLDQSPFVRFNTRYLAVLNAGMDAEGRMRSTPLTVSREVRGGDRTPWAMTQDELRSRLESISSGDAQARMEAITALAQFVVYLSRLERSGAVATVEDWKSELAEQAITTIRERWPSFNASTQAWTVLHFRSAESISDRFRPLLDDLDDTMSRTTEPIVLLAWILTRAPSDENPAWLAARRSEHAGVRRIAELRTQIMEEVEVTSGDQPPDGQ
ncbi:MAG: hypothetical protein ACF8PN_15460 [Phycisphaerales bacterium]